MIDRVIKSVCARTATWTSSTKIFVNPTGRFVIGGPAGDSGLTGRKIIVDTYGGVARHGGGAFSGKDPTKVDRSAAYMMRYVAKNLVAAGLADRLEIQVSYAIGVARPLSIAVETFGTGKVSDELHRRPDQQPLRPAPGRDHPRPGPAPADLQGDGRLRPLRPHRHRRAVGEAGQGRRCCARRPGCSVRTARPRTNDRNDETSSNGAAQYNEQCANGLTRRAFGRCVHVRLSFRRPLPALRSPLLTCPHQV